MIHLMPILQRAAQHGLQYECYDRTGLWNDDISCREN
jgi:hypothetical protein